MKEKDINSLEHTSWRRQYHVVFRCRWYDDNSKTFQKLTKLILLFNEKSKRDNFTNTIYPEGIESVPKQFSISWRNKWMLKQADTVVTYVTHPSSGAWEFKKMALKQGKRVINIS